jgi:hypothetical protein
MLELELELLRQVARAWNNLNIRFIEKELADDCIYKSQWVLTPIEGKRAFLSFLETKFSAIKYAMKFEPITVSAELALHPEIQNRPCIVVTQIANDGIRQVSILIKIYKKKIKCIDVCFIPDPAEAELTGEIPK